MSLDDEQLNARLQKIQQKVTSKNEERDLAPTGIRASAVGLGYAMRLVGEFVAGILVGALLGFGIDEIFSTSPFAMIIFLLLGFAAGVVNVLRVAKQMNEKDNI